MRRRGRQVQDDAREEALARLLELQRTGERIGPDATDEHGNKFELKTTTRQGLSTARDVGGAYLDRMRTQYLIAARGRQTDYGFSFEDIYFLHPDDLEDWIQPLEEQVKGDEAIIDRAHSALATVGACCRTLMRLLYIGKRGSTRNNPKIPWRYITEHGTRLGENPSLDLKELVVLRPLATSGADV